jgi:transposase
MTARLSGSPWRVGVSATAFRCGVLPRAESSSIRHLYRIERELRKSRSGPQLRAAVRAHQARPIYDRLHRVLTRLKMKRRYLPRSGMGLALDYTLNLWTPLGVYLDDGRIEIDQNLVENAIRPTALGKKNWLFIGEAEAGQRSAILYN